MEWRVRYNPRFDRNYSRPGAYPGITPGDTLVSLEPDAVTAVPVTLTVYDSDTTSLTVVLRIKSLSNITPSTPTIALTRSPRSSNFLGILGGSLAVAIMVPLIAWWRKSQPRGVENTRKIYTDTTFSFSQSWATGIAAILTVVATIFTATGVLSNLVPGIDTEFFLAVTIVFGVVLTIAPLVYSALQIPDGAHVYGSRNGFVIAAAITGAAVGGQLSTVGAIISVSDLPGKAKIPLWALLGAVAIVVVWYTEMSRRQLWQLKPPAASPTPEVAALP